MIADIILLPPFPQTFQFQREPDLVQQLHCAMTSTCIDYFLNP